MNTINTHQTLPPCPSRHEIRSRQVYYCSHPKVRIQGNWVSPAICLTCHHHETSPSAREWLVPLDFARCISKQGVAVVIVSHNYGRFLGEAIESVLAQTNRPQEILVVDDDSTDNTREVAESYLGQGVHYLHVQAGNEHRSRKAGYENTTAPMLCFLDADDLLPPDYLERGIEFFADDRIAVVYSDMERFGSRSGLSDFPELFDLEELQRENFIHAGSLVRRAAIEVTAAFEVEPMGPSHADWFFWRRILRQGWQAAKQSTLYRYRMHGSNLSNHHRQDAYYTLANLSQETLTLFVPLSGRVGLWREFAQWLERQNWPHDQIQLILLDSSGQEDFHRLIREWAWQSDYADVRVLKCPVARAGLADEERRDPVIRRLVQRTVAHIYGIMRDAVNTPYVWIVEDDVLPPNDAAEHLMKQFDRETFSVSAVVPSRFTTNYIAWDWHGIQCVQRKAPGRAIEPIGGNGFGCVILRRSAIRDAVFTCSPQQRNFDVAFYSQSRATGNKAKIHWQVVCEHRDVNPSNTKH